MESIKWILLKSVEGEESSRVCGVTDIREVAEAWYWGDGHEVFEMPATNKINNDGLEAIYPEPEKKESEAA